MIGKKNSEESDISQDSILTSTHIFEDILTKHLSSKKEDGKVLLKWNGRLIDFRDFVSLILEFKGNWELKHQDNYEIPTFKEAKSKFKITW